LFSPAILLLMHAFGISTSLAAAAEDRAKRTTPISSSLDSVKNSNQGEISCTNAWPIGRSCEQERIRGQLHAFETSSGNARSLQNRAVCYPMGLTGSSSGVVPEPSTWAMMILGFAGLGFLGYSQTRRAKLQAA
jgi:hypothetical protein